MQMEWPQGPGWRLCMGPAAWTHLPRPGDLLLPLIVHPACNRDLAEALIWRPLTYRGPDILANLFHWVPSTSEEPAVHLYKIYDHSMYGFTLLPNGPQPTPPARASRMPGHRHGVPLSQAPHCRTHFMLRAVQEWAHGCGWDPIRYCRSGS